MLTKVGPCFAIFLKKQEGFVMMSNVLNRNQDNFIHMRLALLLIGTFVSILFTTKKKRNMPKIKMDI